MWFVFWWQHFYLLQITSRVMSHALTTKVLGIPPFIRKTRFQYDIISQYLKANFVILYVVKIVFDVNKFICFIGLCNSQRIDRLLARYLQTRTNCDVCHEGVSKVSKMLKTTDKNDILDKGLSMCGLYMGSYSDACKLSLLENFEDLYR